MVAAKLHTSIRGLSPHAGGFRRRSNTLGECGPSGLTQRLARASPMRAACVNQSPAAPYNTSMRVRLSTPDSISVKQKHAILYQHVRRWFPEICFESFAQDLAAPSARSFAQDLATREGQRPRCPCGGESRAAGTLPLPNLQGFASTSNL